MVLRFIAGYRMKNGTSHITDVMQSTATLTRRNQDKHFDRGRMVGLSQIVAGYRIKKRMLDPCTPNWCAAYLVYMQILVIGLCSSLVLFPPCNLIIETNSTISGLIE